ncbi:MAG: LacI family DNA-binding transcriptional regulator [Mangrovimonas sp.]|nr:LacI family DNA-binding transcriptional regulator [Mangrovimonas sp.]MCB0471325.1 LacI family DNA-binding transcriptional regulator [Flavobacteriaceae bacterium]MCB0425765.1 LacI family DNA-binding transcriptional regulator [Mangrovimonas sp.]MCB0431691.1 LacI family DNA-binding transcriptional regulator [Mangrovimonas sp.]MCB0434479.1 LacI family DNA-binding transcriptional regulator [Mangrovimonas sp.]
MSKKDSVTIYDISKELNISAATVSRALNNNPKISVKTRELVMKTAKKLNYKQNKLALALKSGRTNTVGVIVPYINRNFFSAVIDGIENELSPHGYHVIICQSHENVELEANHVTTLLNTKVDGIFMSVSKSTEDHDHFQKVLNEKVPLVFFDRKKDIQGVSSVTIDDFKGGYLATEHLIKQGATRIAHFSGNLNLEIYRKRHDGYIKALKDYGLPVNEKWIVHTNSKIETGASAVSELWQEKTVPDAIFSASDYAALGAIQELKKLNVSIPDEVSIVGFSNEPFTKFMELPISSVDQTPVLMGQIAAQVFLEQINGNQSLSIEKKVVLAPELYIRKSSNKEKNLKGKPLASME